MRVSCAVGFLCLLLPLSAVATQDDHEHEEQRIVLPLCPEGAQVLRNAAGFVQKCLPFQLGLCLRVLQAANVSRDQPPDAPCCWFNHVDYYCCLNVPEERCPSHVNETVQIHSVQAESFLRRPRLLRAWKSIRLPLQKVDPIRPHATRIANSRSGLNRNAANSVLATEQNRKPATPEVIPEAAAFPQPAVLQEFEAANNELSVSKTKPDDDMKTEAAKSKQESPLAKRRRLSSQLKATITSIVHDVIQDYQRPPLHTNFPPEFFLNFPSRRLVVHSRRRLKFPNEQSRKISLKPNWRARWPERDLRTGNGGWGPVPDLSFAGYSRINLQE